jgi:hypothetical protein
MIRAALAAFKGNIYQKHGCELFVKIYADIYKISVKLWMLLLLNISKYCKGLPLFTYGLS